MDFSSVAHSFDSEITFNLGRINKAAQSFDFNSFRKNLRFFTKNLSRPSCNIPQDVLFIDLKWERTSSLQNFRRYIFL